MSEMNDYIKRSEAMEAAINWNVKPDCEIFNAIKTAIISQINKIPTTCMSNDEIKKAVEQLDWYFYNDNGGAAEKITKDAYELLKRRVNHES